MADVCFYFQVHQPHRLRRYSVFDTDANYFDVERNRKIVRKIAEKCYLPMTRLVLRLIDQYEGGFRVSYSLTGSIIEQLRDHCPEMISLLQKLAATGCVEFLAETYHHSLAFLYSRDEFKAQVEQHAALMDEVLDQQPTVFRNTELIYNNDMASFVASWGKYRGILAEGADHILGYRSPNHIYRPAGGADIKLLLKNYRLSDDIAFRFSNREWPEYPLTVEKYAKWINQINADGDVCNLFMDYETFGEHQWEETGIFKFFEALPRAVLDQGDAFKTVSEALDAHQPAEVYDVPHMISWADTERDLSAWLGNAMQSNALHELDKLEGPIRKAGDEALLADWRKLTTSDHFYYMCTKYFADGAVHKYFNPYESPYDSYINFMNVLDNLRSRVETKR